MERRPWLERQRGQPGSRAAEQGASAQPAELPEWLHLEPGQLDCAVGWAQGAEARPAAPEIAADATGRRFRGQILRTSLCPP
ncbi:MAG: hypothetical protein KGJ51_04585, partial [Acidobacteriota bacterium]|nr:hypothetical protein [Acidobacteriota bacterium]